MLDLDGRVAILLQIALISELKMGFEMGQTGNPERRPQPEQRRSEGPHCQPQPEQGQYQPEQRDLNVNLKAQPQCQPRCEQRQQATNPNRTLTTSMSTSELDELHLHQRGQPLGKQYRLRHE